jgi:hypothetical protein
MSGEGAAMRILLTALAFAGLAAPADAATRNFGVSGFDRIRVDGPFRVTLATGVAPFGKATASSSGALEGVSLEVHGRTLMVRANRSSWGGYPGEAAGPVEVSIGTHELTAAVLNGAGTLAIDKLRGLSFDLSVQGSGAVSVAAVEVDQFKAAVSGTGAISLAGTALKLTATVNGVSTLQATSLNAKDATFSVNGPATVRATVTGTAKISARGPSSVELTGSPACTITAAGSANVTGCR